MFIFYFVGVGPPKENFLVLLLPDLLAAFTTGAHFHLPDTLSGHTPLSAFP